MDPNPSKQAHGADSNDPGAAALKRQAEAVEAMANTISEDLSNQIASLRNALHSISSMSSQQMLAYQNAIVGVGDAVNSTVVTAHDFVEKCVALNDELAPLDTLIEHIKEVKKLLVTLEMRVASMK